MFHKKLLTEVSLGIKTGFSTVFEMALNNPLSLSLVYLLHLKSVGDVVCLAKPNSQPGFKSLHL